MAGKAMRASSGRSEKRQRGLLFRHNTGTQTDADVAANGQPVEDMEGTQVVDFSWDSQGKNERPRNTVPVNP